MDEKKVDPETEDVLMQHGYPSPADAADAQYYHVPAQRDAEMGQQPEDTAHLLPDGLPNAEEPQEQHAEHSIDQNVEQRIEQLNEHQQEPPQEPQQPDQHAELQQDHQQEHENLESHQHREQLEPPLEEQPLEQQPIQQQLVEETPIEQQSIEQQSLEHQQHHEQHQHIGHHEHHEHEHHDLHELQELQEASPSQQHSRPSVSAEELQLAAQLTQGLAPMMAAASQAQAQEQPMQPEEPDMNQGSDPDIQGQLQAQLQNHDQELHNVMTHPEQPQTHHYVQEPPQPSHMTHIPIQIDHLQHPAYQSMPDKYALPDKYPISEKYSDNTPPRKRSKVSRACDECRRKKIKCDAQSEASEQPCSNCRRSSAQCLFSRVPQKRGPSKGYIKELADRINTIEGKLVASAGADGLDVAARRSSAEAFASPVSGDEGRKRPFSSISANNLPSPTPERLGAWTSDGHRSDSARPEHRPLLPYHHSAQGIQPPSSVNSLAPKPMAMFHESVLQGLPDALADGLPPEGSVPDGLPQVPGAQEPLSTVEPHSFVIDDVMFDCYLAIFHRLLPVLASNKDRVQTTLSQCPLLIQDAFSRAFSAMVTPFLSRPGTQPDADYLAACLLIGQWEGKRPRHCPPIVDLVNLQVLVMLVIATDYNSGVKGQLNNPSKLTLLGKAAALGAFMKLYSSTPDVEPAPGVDADSDDKVALRAWWTLIALDRWNATGSAMPQLITQRSAVIYPGLKHVIGDAAFLFAQVSSILGEYQPPSSRLPPEVGLNFGFKSGMSVALDMVRLQFPVDQVREAEEPIVHLAFFHTRLLANLSHGPPGLKDALDDCANIVRLLTANPHLRSPITHHFVALAGLALVELYKLKSLREEADRLIKDMRDYQIAPSPWNNSVRRMLKDKTVISEPPMSSSDSANAEPNTSTSAEPTVTATAAEALSTSQNLQQLADLATAVDGSVAGLATGAPNASGAVPVGDGDVKDSADALEAAVAAAAAVATAVENAGQRDTEDSKDGTITSNDDVVMSDANDKDNQDNVNGNVVPEPQFNANSFLSVGYLCFFADKESSGL